MFFRYNKIWGSIKSSVYEVSLSIVLKFIMCYNDEGVYFIVIIDFFVFCSLVWF